MIPLKSDMNSPINIFLLLFFYFSFFFVFIYHIFFFFVLIYLLLCKHSLSCEYIKFLLQQRIFQ